MISKYAIDLEVFEERAHILLEDRYHSTTSKVYSDMLKAVLGEGVDDSGTGSLSLLLVTTLSWAAGDR